ncbi:ABC transporter substrate-binding protein [Candidatus Aciduliprofundum boonei]|uniref:Extracellular solute-binding protein family 5 n=1 Tax=Aciduliprofundum boonei (strain DSM 19572 / T469) TaxID=439481 RepID=B5ICR8_ACIB4|nr:ABC transporter substrate-binding protein [Candidatus Aciduliprofundum boonei]ADD09150.1 extracellular solute-binding protein family 5 [Aciduliprofundum boonei T469]EDY35937.1 Bacterial extracellular solute-binding protein, family 5 [Aciduliprofundum boonei T469]
MGDEEKEEIEEVFEEPKSTSKPPKSKSLGKIIAAIVAVIIVIAAIAGVWMMSQHGEENKKPVVAPKVLYVAGTSDVTTWDPSYSYSTEAEYLANIYEPLIWANPPGSGKPFGPALATSWEVSSNGLTWTFHLRHNVTFHNGDTLDAQDVIFSIQRTLTTFYTTYEGAGFLWWPVVDNWKTLHVNITAPDDYTVVFHLTYAIPLDRVAAAIYGAWIFSSKLPEGVNESSLHGWFEQGHDLGSGPYTLSDYQTGKKIVLKGYDKYWGGWNDTQYKEVDIDLTTPQPSTQTQKLQAGEIDIAKATDLSAIDNLKKDPKISVYISPSAYNYIGYINIWAYHPELAKQGLDPYPFTHKEVRQAISYGINYQEVLRAGVLGYGRQAKGPVPYGLWPHTADVDSLLKQYNYDIQKAKDLLAAAGYPSSTTDGKPMAEDGSNAWMILRLNYTAENAVEAAYAPVIQKSLADLGIFVKINALEWKTQWSLARQVPADKPADWLTNETFLKKVFGPKQDIFMILWWPSMADGYDNLNSMFADHSYPPLFNLCYWYNSTYDSLLWQAYIKTSTDPSTAKSLYVKAMNLLIDQAPALFLIDVQSVLSMKSNIGGYTPNLYYPRTIFFYQLYYIGE